MNFWFWAFWLVLVLAAVNAAGWHSALKVAREAVDTAHEALDHAERIAGPSGQSPAGR